MDDFNIYDYIAIFKRHRWAYVVTSLVMLVLTMVVTFSWSSYRSEATIQVQQPDIPQEMTTPLGVQAATVIRALADQRIEQINEKVTSNSSLVEIITKFNLYEEDRRTKPMTTIVETMRKKIKLDLVSADLANPTATARMEPGQLAAIAFVIGFTYNNPRAAQQVTNELVSRILDEDIRQRRNQAKETSEFLQVQTDALEKTLLEQERKLADFKAAHPSVRIETIPLTHQEIQLIEMNLQQVSAQADAIDKMRGDLRAQLAGTDPYSRVIADGQLLTTASIQLKNLQSKYSTMTSQYGPDHPDVVKLRHQIEALQTEVGQTPDTAVLQAQIKDTRANLAAAEQTNGPDHPDVLALRRQLTGLEGQLAVLAKDPTPHSEIKRDADNPAYLMLVSQLHAADDQFTSLATQRNDLNQQLNTLRKDVLETPAFEQQLEALSRDYDNAQLRYRELKEKKLTADMNEQMEQGRTAERLVMIDPPELPVDTHPKRILLFVASIFLSFMSGFGGVALTEKMSLNVHGPIHLASLINAPPLVVIPHIFTQAEVRQTRRARLRNTGAALGALVILGVIFDQTVMPIDVLWSVILNRLGFS
jgi:uncharacterized protein involved in exopolysaccharide biosynthesis